MRALALIVLVAACSDLDSIETGVCGNGAIDATEDCDSTDTTQCMQCQLVCQGDEHTCPAGYACGADNFCRAPSGVFYEAGAVTFPVSEYAVSDINWDGAGDVLGLTPTSISVLQGDTTPIKPGQNASPFSTQFSMLTPFGRGDPVFARLDDDARPDVLLPTADGIAGFSTKYQTLAPHAFAFDPGGADDGNIPDIPLVFSFHPSFVSFLFPDPFMPKNLVMGILDVGSGATGPNIDFLPTVCTTIDATKPLTYDSYITEVSPLRALVAIRDTLDHVCLFRITVPGAGTNPFAILQLGEAVIPNSTPPVFADLDGTGCPSLMAAPGKEVRAATTSPCTLVPALSDLPANIPTSVVGRVPIQIAGFGRDALITPFYVFAVPPDRSLAAQLYASDRRIDATAFGDIDGDGNIDAVLASSMSNGVDVLFRTGPAFLPYRIATTGVVTHVVAGEFDGNGAADIVFIERLDDERLMVAYGTPDRPLPPVENGRFTNVGSFLIVQIADSIDRFKLVKDLAVVDEVVDPTDPTQDKLQLTVLHGSPQRTLVSYFDPRNGGGSNFELGTGFFSAVAGQFETTTTANDVIAIEWSLSRGDARLYLNIGIGEGALDQLTEQGPVDPQAIWFNLQNVVEGERCAMLPSAFCLDHARYLALRRSPIDKLIGIDRAPAPHAVVIEMAKLTPATEVNNTPTNVVATLAGLQPGAGFSLLSLRAADVDGDGLDDAIAAFVSPSAQTAQVRVCMHDAFDNCPLLTDLANVPDIVCGDVAAAHAQPRGALDPPVTGNPAEPMPLVALCTDAVGRHVYRFVKTGETFEATRLFAVSPTMSKLEVGDVNGDGIDDVLALDTFAGTAAPQLVPYLQCRSSDVDCRNGIVTTTGAAP
jgi:hypothetical protein